MSFPRISMVPLVASLRPMMVRSSTDLPDPDPPTSPTISPRNTSKSRLSWTMLSPNCVRTPRSLSTTSRPSLCSTSCPPSGFPPSGFAPSGFAPSGLPPCSLSFFRLPAVGLPSLGLLPSDVRQQKDDREYRVEHDDAEDRFHHRARRELADAFGAAVDLKPLAAADRGDHGTKHRRLDHARVEMPRAHRVAQPFEELHEGEIEEEGAGDGAAQQAGHIAPEGQQRHGDDEGHDARQDQPFDGIEPHCAHGIDFQVDLHGADLGREGA